MAASQSSKLLSSKLSTSLRNLIHLHHHSATAKTTATAAAVSLTGKLPFVVNERPKLAENVADSMLLGRVDWPAFSHQQFAVIEASDRNHRKVDSDSDDDDDDDDDFDDDFDDADFDDDFDDTTYDDEVCKGGSKKRYSSD